MDYTISNRMSTLRGSAIREIFKYAADPAVISLAGGNPNPELFPNEALSDIAAEILREQPVTALQYGITEGYTPLREAIRERLARVENIGSENDDLIVVSGGQQGIELATKCLVNEGDTVIVELPSFIGATNAFRSYGTHLVGVPVEQDGMDLDALERALAENDNVRFIYTIPTFQNPMGVTMSLEKRKKLYEIAKKNGVLILEDNPYGELTFNGVKTPTIKSMDTEGIVMYSGSFSKILAPGLRLGFMCAPRPIIQKMVIAKQVSDVHTPMLPQLLATEYMKRYDLDALILKMRENYAHKCKTMLDAMEQYFPADVTYTRPGGGLFIWCDLGHGLDTFALSKKAIEQKVVYVPGNTFMVDMDQPTSTLRLNYSTMSDEKIVEGIRRLGIVFGEALK
ncbi:MAG: PLP-dependent aminotransferase family protein [Ruminococcaceae bacterium]|nr:PLP-dependent aminotransferase family protein [Oscillospiraceae bacterium]